MTLSDSGGRSVTHGHNGHDSHGGHADHLLPVPTWTATELSAEVIGKFAKTPAALNTWTLITGVLFVIGLVGIALKFVQGVPSQGFGYYAATVAFLLSTFGAAPLAVVASRLTKGDWSRPLRRYGETFGVVPTLIVLLSIPLLFALPANIPGQKTMWFGWPLFPHFWDVMMLLGLALAGAGMLYASVRPDLALARAAGVNSPFVSKANAFVAGLKQWRITRTVLTPLGGMYLWMFVGAGLMVSTDWILSLVPGWQDPIFPAYFSIAGIQGGLATLIVTLWVTHKLKVWHFPGTGKQYYDFYENQIWGLSKLMLALSLLWIYFWISSAMLFWYGRLPREVSVMSLMMTGPSLWLQIASIVLCWFIPLFTLMWNKIRRSVNGPFVVAVIILVGNFLNHIRLFQMPWSLTDHVGEENMLPFEHIPNFIWPRLEDYLIMPGLIAGGVFVYLLALRFVPQLSIWEMREGIPTRIRRKYLDGEVVIIGKPE